MIVRIAGEGRWLLTEDQTQRLLADDGRLIRAVEEGREVEYQSLLVALCRYVRSHGECVSAADFRGDADMTVPPPRMSMVEIGEVLSKRPGLSAE